MVHVYRATSVIDFSIDALHIGLTTHFVVYDTCCRLQLLPSMSYYKPIPRAVQSENCRFGHALRNC